MAAVDDVARGLAGWLHGRQFGSVRVLTSRASIGSDLEDEPSAFLDLTLSDPEPGADTWPLDDVLALRRAVLRKASDLDLPVRIYVRITPDTDAPQQDDPPALLG